MKKLLISLFIITVSGCATLKPAQLPLIETAGNHLKIENAREKNDAETEMLSYLITSCNYGIQRLGDEWVTPDKMAYFANRVSQELPQAKQLTVNNFVTYLNMQYQLREGNIYRGPIWELFECDENTDEFVTYSQEENPQRMNMIIGTLKGSIDGVIFSERTALFPACPQGVSECTGWDAQALAVKKIIIELTDKVLDKHKKHSKGSI